jgi:hypothetical protein
VNPLDPAMPFLESALHRAEAEAVFAALARHDGTRVSIEEIELIRHKPGRRAVIQYKVRMESATTARAIEVRSLIGKARAKGLDRKSFRVTKELCAEFKRTEPKGVCVPRPYDVVPAFNMWLQDKVSGEPLGKILLSDDSAALPSRIAEAAYKVHRSAVWPTRTHTVADELRILRERLAVVAAARPEWNGRLGKLMEQCHTLALTLPPITAQPIHRDFYPGQIIVDGVRLWLLDFDLFSFGDPAVDVGNFIAHVTELSLRQFGDERRLTAMEQDIEDTYVSLAGEDVRPRIRIYVLLTLARHIYISTQFEERRAFTDRLLGLCEQRTAAVS